MSTILIDNSLEKLGWTVEKDTAKNSRSTTYQEIWRKTEKSSLGSSPEFDDKYEVVLSKIGDEVIMEPSMNDFKDVPVFKADELLIFTNRMYDIKNMAEEKNG